MKEINGYILFSELKTTNSGFSKWGFAQRNGSRFFIKELIDPIYPVCADLLDSGVVARKRAICQQFEDLFRCDSHYYLVMEKIDAIGIDEVMAIPIEDRVRICKALVHCLGRLHQRGIVHADIKLDNILFRRLPSGKVTGKLIDFDNCFWEMQPPLPDEEIHGDLVYMAPETFMMMQTETGTIDRAIDVFALGLVFHQIFTGRLPAFDARAYDYPFEAVLDGATLAVDAAIPDAWRDLIAQMLKTDPRERISLEIAEGILKGGTTVAAPAAETNPFLAPAGDLL